MKYFCLLLTAVFFLTSCTVPTDGSVSVPILMYHDFTSDETSGNAFTIPASRFEEHLTALEEAGYRSVTFAELIDYVCFGGKLPEKPVLITSDDGYTSVPGCAALIAARHGMTISCAVIGSLSGVNGHFSFDTPLPANLEIVSHTYALHDRSGWNGMVTDDVWLYEPILEKDCTEMRNLCAERFPLTEWVLIYPHGHYSAESERILHAQGFRVTVTCDPGIAQLRRGDAESLYLLPRISVWPGMTAAEVLVLAEGKR